MDQVTRSEQAGTVPAPVKGDGSAASGWLRARCWFRARWFEISSLAIVASGLGARLWLFDRDISSPHKDENEVVEQAVAFMGGKLEYFFPKYGPLTMYVLAAIYRARAWLSGQSALEYASRVFYDGAEHYLLARGLCAAVLSVTGLAAAYVLRRHFGARAGLLAAALIGLPGIEVLTRGYARVDVLQGALQAGALLALMEVVRSGRRWSWAVAGMCAGLAVAAKPLPGALVAPCFPLASWFASAGSEARGRLRFLRRLRSTLLGPMFWLALPVAVGAALLANPSMHDIRQFADAQIGAVRFHSRADTTLAYRTLGATLSEMGVPFAVLAALSCALAVLQREARRLLLVSFIAVYVAAFWGSNSRAYYMVAPALAAALLVAAGPARPLMSGRRAFERLTQRWVWFAGPALVVLSLAPASRELWSARDGVSASTRARAWMQEHVPAGTKLFYAGPWPDGPRLVATQPKLQLKWADHLDYGRTRYPFLKRAFEKGYADYVASGRPRYPITVHDRRPFPRRQKASPRWLTDSLVKRARKRGEKYIILTGYRVADVKQLEYPWFGEAKLEAQFGAIAIFSVPPAG